MSNFEAKLERLKQERLAKYQELGKIQRDSDSDGSSGNEGTPDTTNKTTEMTRVAPVTKTLVRKIDEGFMIRSVQNHAPEAAEVQHGLPKAVDQNFNQMYG